MNITQKILIVEDDTPIQLMYILKLEGRGFDVSTASDGSEGLSKAKEYKPSLILLDLHMPRMNGDEMLARLRTTSWGAKIRIIILTNVSKNEGSSTLLLLRLDRYIVKAHYTPKQVADIVEEVLAQNR